MYKFNPAMDAISAKKERFVWLGFMGVVFFLLYGSSNQFASLNAPNPSLFMEWETQIPFIEVFIIPYMSSDLMFVIAFLLPYTRLELRILAARVLFIVALSTLIFTLFPLEYSFAKPKIEEFPILFGMLQADLPYNQLPSLHISFSIVLWASMKKYLKPKWLKYIVASWFYLIALSTLFVFQHHFIDIPTGIIMGLFATWFISKDKNSYFISGFSTPRSIKMGFYYLIASAIFMILSFYIVTFQWFFIWIFLSLFSVSIVYALGLNTMLVGENAKANIWQWLLFFPYFAGNYISWNYYKSRISLMATVVPKIYLGRFPTKDEYKDLSSKSIGHTINLASEQQLHKASIKETRLPFLDQTIQSPESLHRGVELIELYKEDGVYVHCALGLSRSVLLISAWLLYQKYTLEEVDELIANIRPNYIKSEYMKINLEIYQNYLNLYIEC
ncbi:phosphatase PAP2 family protein [Sulfurimonas sp.]|uniref:phosphatase PAP2 family protein n=1 Tax=Sulfurimonas sp. TaxID=2022749 RepID=UPI002B475DA1|nr:dual specificity protein phosphatase family protein [Sulfurimonas sp.]